MKALTFNPENDQFKVADLPVPEPGALDVLVEVDACGLNPVDAKIRYWKGAATGMDRRWVPGLDVSGRIVEVGESVVDWQVGDRIVCHGNMFRPSGGFAEFSIQDSETIIAHPEVSAEIAAATPCAGWTAWRALVDKLRIADRPSIFIAGGSGGVGGFAVQIARYFGLETIIATCSAKNADYVRKLGATHVIDYRSEDVVGCVLEKTRGQGVAVGLDTVGGENALLVANSLGFEGQMVDIVDVVAPREYKDAFGKGLSFHQLSLGSGHRHGPAGKATLTTAGGAFSALLEEGQIKVPALQTISLEETGAALNGILKKRTVGKIVMVN